MGVTLAAWLAALQALLPPGRGLSRDPNAVLTRVLSAIAALFLAAQIKLEGLLDEMDPRRAIAMLPDWERLLGLPDACTPTVGLNNQERQRLAYQRLVEQGGQSRAYFLGLAEQLGEPNSWIDEFRQMTCNSNCDSTLYSQADEFAWRVNFRRAPTDARVMNCGDNCDSALRSAKASLAQCPIDERKPAHTKVVFAYGQKNYLPADLQQFHTRASVAWAFDANGVLQQYAANVLRVVSSPVGVTSALREPQSTNYCKTGGTTGAVVGTIGAGGAAPTNWGAGNNGSALVWSVQAIGVENGIPYVDLRLSGNAAAGSEAYIWFNPSNGTPAANGQTWTESLFAKQVAGSTANINNVQLRLQQYNAALAALSNLASADLKAALAAVAEMRDSRRILTVTTNDANTAFLWPVFVVNHTAGAIDVTYRVGIPQVEQLPFATTPMLSNGAAFTRARDEIALSMDLAHGATFGALVDFVLARNGVSSTVLVGGDGQRILGVDANIHASNNATQLSLANGYVNGTRGKAAYAQDVSGRSISANGAAALSDADVAQTTAHLLIGQRVLGADTEAVGVMHIHEFRTYRWRMTAAELQAATA